MIDFKSLLEKTNAFKLIQRDKKQERLSHAYLLFCPDVQFLGEYLKIFAKEIMCDSAPHCNNCRSCRLIDGKAHPDVLFFPKGEGVVLSSDVNQIIEETFLKPVESQKKVFVIENAQTMNASAQNKLLKTLEEPPKNVHILLGATNEFALLPTIKSRVRKLELPFFNKEQLRSALKDECPDQAKLDSAIACADGTVGKVLSLYGDQSFLDAQLLCKEVLINMQSSKDLLLYSNKVTASNVTTERFLAVLELYLRDMLAIDQGKDDLAMNQSQLQDLKSASRFNTGSIIHALEKVLEAHKRLKFNANPTMLIEWLLFQILEGKYKWQKL